MDLDLFCVGFELEELKWKQGRAVVASWRRLFEKEMIKMRWTCIRDGCFLMTSAGCARSSKEKLYLVKTVGMTVIYVWAVNYQRWHWAKERNGVNGFNQWIAVLSGWLCVTWVSWVIRVKKQVKREVSKLRSFSWRKSVEERKGRVVGGN